MKFEGIIVINLYSGLPLFSRLESSIDDSLFSGFLSAIRGFASEISLGGLTSFKTDEMNVNLIIRNKVIVAILSSKDISFEKVNSFGYRIGERFEEEFKIDEFNSNIDNYERFNEILDEMIKENNIPFLISVAEFSKKEFGGELSIESTLVNKNQKKIKIDLILDRGKKKGWISKWVKSFSADVTFIKVIEGIAGRGEIQDFLDMLRTFGNLRSKNLPENEYPFYPSRAIVIAKEFSPTIDEITDKMPKYKGKANLPGTHIAIDAGMKGAPASAKCFIEFWKWRENSYPERIFN